MLYPSHLKLINAHDLAEFCSPREGEQKLGQSVMTPMSWQGSETSLQCRLEQLYTTGVRYAVLGIPEDIGPRANAGRGGSTGAWEAFLATFLNVQSNPFIDPAQILLLGSVDVEDLQLQASSLSSAKHPELNQLRELCAQIDARVAPIIRAICAAGLEPIVIGGGHNNAYPILQGASQARIELGQSGSLVSLNCDPHADMRPREGRHSGNPFTFAHAAGILHGYYVIGLHESYNSAATLAALSNAGFKYTSYEQITMERTLTWEQAIASGIAYAQPLALPVGIELDVDSISLMPSSAETPNGISTADAAYYVYQSAKSLPDTAYLHLAEGAPALHPDATQGRRHVGRVLSAMVLAYIKGRRRA